MKNCLYRGDSTDAMLKQRLGMAYFGLSDYLKAIQYLRQSIQISDIALNRKFNILNYFYVSAAYDSLNNIGERLKAIDSCVSIAMQLKSGSDIACLYSLFAWILLLEEIIITV